MSTSRARLLSLGVAGAIVLAGAAAGASAWRPPVTPIAPPAPTAFAPEQVARGAVLAAIGDCSVCHTATGGRPYAGGRPLPTQFGTIYVTNITPDARDGIGAWSEKAFRRAMREGIGRSGRHLYPALPYPHFTRATDDDIAALYAFLMTRAPVQATAPANELSFPLGIRATLAGWNALFLRPGPWRPDPTRDAAWNRGAYLVEAVGHCGACHTARNALGAERANALGGGEAEGWHAPALAGEAARAPGRAWTVAALATYLRSGMEASHGTAAGPMEPVTQELAQVPEQDIWSIAVYVASAMPRHEEAPPGVASAAPGNAAFAGACAACHAADAPMARDGAPSLALGYAANAPTPRNAVQVILHGLPWREGAPAPYMPGFAATLADAQVADLVRYLRAQYSREPAWADVDETVRSVRSEGGAEAW